MGGGEEGEDEGLMSSLGCDLLNQSSDLILDAVSTDPLVLKRGYDESRAGGWGWGWGC